MELRPYQSQVCDEVEANVALGSGNIVIEAPTGSGKSLIIAELTRRFGDDGVIIVVNITKLIEQIAEHLDELKIDYSILKAGMEHRFDPNKKVQLVMSQTFHARRDRIRFKHNFKTWIQDEVHKEYFTDRTRELLRVVQPNVRIGMSATPYTAEGYALPDVDDYVVSITIPELEKQGFLSPLKYFIPKWSQEIDYDEMRMSGADYSGEAIEELIGTPEYARAVAKSLAKLDPQKEKKTIVFANSIEHSDMIAEALKKEGFVAYSYHSKSDGASETMLDSFRNNKPVQTDLFKGTTEVVRVLVSVLRLSIGFDVKDIDIGVMCRPTKVLSLWRQQLGRLCRVAPGKEYGMILDLCGGTSRLGFHDEPYVPPKHGDRETLRKKMDELAKPEIDLLVKEEPTEVTPRMVLEKVEELKRESENVKSAQIEKLMAIFETSKDPKKIIEIAMEIYWRKYGIPYNSRTLEWVAEGVQQFFDVFPQYENRLLKTLRTRSKNIVARGKKLVSLRYFFSLDPDEGFLIEQYPYNAFLKEKPQEVEKGYELVIEDDYDIDEDEIPF